jgi:hypothetical protein
VHLRQHPLGTSFAAECLTGRYRAGLGQSCPDGVSAKTARAVPCSTAARETDGTTTCIGIPEGSGVAKGR